MPALKLTSMLGSLDSDYYLVGCKKMLVKWTKRCMFGKFLYDTEMSTMRRAVTPLRVVMCVHECLSVKTS